VLGFFQFENHVLTEFFVVFAEFELFAGGEIPLLNGGNVPHDSALGRDAGHVRALSLCHNLLKFIIAVKAAKRGKYIGKPRFDKSILKNGR
jgi:hypothetical protein